jgi:restriction endonuclease S subunit
MPEYLLTFLNSGGFVDQVTTLISGSAQPQLPINRLSHVKLMLPPVSQQEEFVRGVKQIRELEVEQSLSRSRLADLFNSMLDRAFHGEL